MLTGDDQPRFGQQEMHVRDAAVERILDGNDRAIRAPVLHRVDGIGEIEARQRQPVGERLRGGDMAVRAGCALERDRPFRRGGGSLGHRGDDGASGGGKVLHGGEALRMPTPLEQACLRRFAAFSMGMGR